jgi:hypothetical protein
MALKILKEEAEQLLISGLQLKSACTNFNIAPLLSDSDDSHIYLSKELASSEATRCRCLGNIGAREFSHQRIHMYPQELKKLSHSCRSRTEGWMTLIDG